MTVEQFLLFWNQYNMSIIEGLVAVIIILCLFLGYQTFFGKNNSESAEGGLDAAQLEQVLEKFVHALPADKGTGTSEKSEELESLSASLTESKALIDSLKAQLAEAQKLAAIPIAPAAPATGEPTLNLPENEALQSKIRDLETRLSEYEIISQDIADLARYKEENAKIRLQLEGLMNNAPPPPSPQVMPEAVAPIPSPIDAEPIPEAKLSPVSEVPSVETESSPLAPSETPIETPAETPAESIPEKSPEEIAENLIDDDLMKEFALAVENQQQKTTAAAAPPAPTEMQTEAMKLMEDFESFVSKKQ